MSGYITKPDTTAEVYGLTVTLFGQSAERNVRIGRDTGSGHLHTCSMQGCRQRVNVYVERTVEVDVNADARSRAFDRDDRPIPPVVLGFRFITLWACAGHFMQIIDRAYLLPGYGQYGYKLRIRKSRTRTVCVRQGRFPANPVHNNYQDRFGVG